MDFVVGVSLSVLIVMCALFATALSAWYFERRGRLCIAEDQCELSKSYENRMKAIANLEKELRDCRNQMRVNDERFIKEAVSLQELLRKAERKAIDACDQLEALKHIYDTANTKVKKLESDDADIREHMRRLQALLRETEGKLKSANEAWMSERNVSSKLETILAEAERESLKAREELEAFQADYATLAAQSKTYEEGLNSMAATLCELEAWVKSCPALGVTSHETV